MHVLLHLRQVVVHVTLTVQQKKQYHTKSDFPNHSFTESTCITTVKNSLVSNFTYIIIITILCMAT